MRHAAAEQKPLRKKGTSGFFIQSRGHNMSSSCKQFLRQPLNLRSPTVAEEPHTKPHDMDIASLCRAMESIASDSRI